MLHVHLKLEPCHRPSGRSVPLGQRTLNLVIDPRVALTLVREPLNLEP